MYNIGPDPFCTTLKNDALCLRQLFGCRLQLLRCFWEVEAKETMQRALVDEIHVDDVCAVLQMHLIEIDVDVDLDVDDVDDVCDVVEIDVYR